MTKLSKKHLKIIESYKQATELPCYNLAPVEGKPSETDSKMGGFPYLPKGASVPKDENGKPIPLISRPRAYCKYLWRKIQKNIPRRTKSYITTA